MALMSEFEAHVISADLLQAVVDDAVSQFREIALAAQVTEIQMAQVGGHDLLGGISGGLVREMPMAAKNALLEAPGPARAILQHLDIMVRLQHERVGWTDPFKHQPCRVAKVGQEADIAGTGVEEETNGILGVVWDTERLDRDVADLEARARGEELAGQPRLKLILDCFLSRSVAIDGNAQFLAQRGQAVHVVGMLVGDEYCGQVLRRTANSGEALANLAQAETRVNKYAGLCGLHIGAIAGGTAAKDGQANSHSSRYEPRNARAMIFAVCIGRHPSCGNFDLKLAEYD
jgi:hypothetical protein